jgi:hypothetical protein
LESCSHDDEIVVAIYRLDAERSQAEGKVVYVAMQEAL